MKIAAILDNVRSVHNVGSIFRTADGAGVEKIYCCGITPGPLDRFKAIRADFAKVSLGAENSVAWELAGNTADAVQRLKTQGWEIVAVEQASHAMPYYEFKPRAAADGNEKKVALVLGSETDGIAKTILDGCDTVLEIPMRGKKESLNVAVAFGVAAYALSRYDTI